MSAKNLHLVAPSKRTRSSVDTILLTEEKAVEWQPPPFQRTLKVNDKVRELAEEIKADGGVLPGVITLGKLKGRVYLLDGQHRVEAWRLSGLSEGYCDVRVIEFDSMGEMGKEFVHLNSHLVKFTPDNILQGLEADNIHLSFIRNKCRFVGYDSIRRNPDSPVVSMSALLRSWFASGVEVPTSSGKAAIDIANSLTDNDARTIVDFLNLAWGAWGGDKEYHRLWGALNLTICLWLYRRTVITPYSPKTVKLSKEGFQACLMSLSANEQYLKWLMGRGLRETDRSPAYSRVKQIFTKRIADETGKKALLPAPAWAHSGGHKPLREE